MAFPTTGVLDNFTRANAATLGANYGRWVMRDVASDMQIVSNAAKAPDANGAEGAAYYNVATYGPDCEVHATLSFFNDSSFLNYAWLGLRLQDPGGATTNDGYTAEPESQAGTDNVYIQRFDNDVSTQLGATVAQEWAAGDSLGIEMVSSTLTLYRKTGGTWSSITTRTDSTYSGAGYIGLGAVGYTADTAQKPIFDDFGGGTVVTAGGTAVKDMIGGGIIPWSR